MKTKFGVYHPKTGETHVVNTKEEAINLFYKFMIDFSREFFHNTMYLTIIENDDGTVTHYNDGNEVDKILSPAELEALWKESEEIQEEIRINKT